VTSYAKAYSPFKRRSRNCLGGWHWSLISKNNFSSCPSWFDVTSLQGVYSSLVTYLTTVVIVQHCPPKYSRKTYEKKTI